MQTSEAFIEVANHRKHIYRKGWDSLCRSVGTITFFDTQSKKHLTDIGDYVLERCVGKAQLSADDIKADDWELMDNPRERLTITNYLEMPSSVKILQDVKDLSDNTIDKVSLTDEERERHIEAMFLGLIEQKGWKTQLTELGIKTLNEATN